MPKIFIIIIVLLILGGVGLWYFSPGGSENEKPPAWLENSQQSADSPPKKTSSDYSDRSVKGSKARAILLINPQAFPEGADVNKIAQEEAEWLNKPKTLQTLLRSPSCKNLPTDLLAEVQSYPNKYIQAKAAGNSSFIELDVQSGSQDSAGQLARAIANAYIQYARANNLPPNRTGQADAILLTRVVPLD